MRRTTLTHKFVEFIPETLEDGILYISMEYATVTHRCCCGCGREVVTPLSPTDWKLAYDGKTISLQPSIGSWSLPCRSHYWIKQNRVRWAEQWNDRQIASNRARSANEKEKYLSGELSGTSDDLPKKVAAKKKSKGVLARIKGVFKRS